ncbi:MAG TPA: rhomboid family intramembrane serine protease [Rhodanobacteraceae bacterium]|nr:rhomboid family intramembrane serine protease [Rhodanobacteraceae bacterium]
MQAFGSENLSGTDTKTGSPHFLLRYVTCFYSPRHHVGGMARLNFDLDPTDTSAASVAADKRKLRRAWWLTLACVGVLWVILLLQWALGFDPGRLGVWPRQEAGLLGVLTAPLVHEGFAHLAANSSALLVLGVLALRVYPRALRIALPVVWLGSGALVWWLARPSSHIGASGIAVGLMLFLFAMGLLRRERLAIVTSMVVFFLYGSMLHSMLPGDPHISFEYHLFGGFCGLLSAFFLYRRDPLPPRKLYSWDLEDEDEDTAGTDGLEYDHDAPPMSDGRPRHSL